MGGFPHCYGMMITPVSVIPCEPLAEASPRPAKVGAEVAALLGDVLAKLERVSRMADGAGAPPGFSGSLATAAELLGYARNQAHQIGAGGEAAAASAPAPTAVAAAEESPTESASSINEDLGDLLPQILAPAGVEWDVFGQPEAALLPREVQQAIFDILREVLVNTARHAQANRVTLHYFHSDACFRMRVADDGKGFCLHHPRKSLGLARMRERAQLLGGELKVESAPWAGTRVVLTMPISTADLREDIPA